MAQENLIKASSVPYTIVRATQFFEFVSGIAQSATEGQTVRLPPALMQPIASDDVAAALADIAVEERFISFDAQRSKQLCTGVAGQLFQVTTRD